MEKFMYEREKGEKYLKGQHVSLSKGMLDDNTLGLLLSVVLNHVMYFSVEMYCSITVIHHS